MEQKPVYKFYIRHGIVHLYARHLHIPLALPVQIVNLRGYAVAVVLN